MHPRQRSKCFVTVAFSVTEPSRRASIRWMRPRGESISSCQSTYVGHVGRQNPQWTQSAVSSRITRRAPPAGRAPGESRRRGSAPRPGFLRGLVRDVRDARRRAHDRLRERSEGVREAGGVEADPPPGHALTQARLVPHVRPVLGAADERASGRELRVDCPLGPLEERPPHARDGGTSSALGSSCEPRSASTAEAGSSVSTTSVPVARGSGWSRKLARAISASRPREPQTSRARS